MMMLRMMWKSCSYMFHTTSGVRLAALLLLCLQNSLYAVVRRYSQGILHETYSKCEVLLLGELLKLVVSAWVVRSEQHVQLQFQQENQDHHNASKKETAKNVDLDDTTVITTTTTSCCCTFSLVWPRRLLFLLQTCQQMVLLALLYGAMSILSFVALQNMGAGTYIILSQTKILTTALFSSVMLNRQYTWTQWRALVTLLFGVLLFIISQSENISNNIPPQQQDEREHASRLWLGILCSWLEVTISGFAIIYFEKMLKKQDDRHHVIDSQQLTIWERNFQLSLASVPVYVVFLVAERIHRRDMSSSSSSPAAGFFTGWSWIAVAVSCLYAAGGLLVALAIKYGDAILKTLATSMAIVISSVLDYIFLDGPRLTFAMTLCAGIVILAISSYTLDATPLPPSSSSVVGDHPDEPIPTTSLISDTSSNGTNETEGEASSSDDESLDEEVALLGKSSEEVSRTELAEDVTTGTKKLIRRK